MSDQTYHSTAASREKNMTTKAAEPFSLWLFSAVGVLIVLAGSVMLGGGNLFDYNNTVAIGYTTPTDGKGPKPVPAMEAYTKEGKAMFAQCIVCHKADGKGDGTAFPPLAGSDWVNGPSLRPAMIILNGLQGPITVSGKEFGISQMTPQAHIKGAKELASVLNYIRNSFGNTNEKLITIEMAQQAFDLTEKRGAGKPMTAKELNADYKKELEGKEIAPDALVHPKTFKVVE